MYWDTSHDYTPLWGRRWRCAIGPVNILFFDGFSFRFGDLSDLVFFHKFSGIARMTYVFKRFTSVFSGLFQKHFFTTWMLTKQLFTRKPTTPCIIYYVLLCIITWKTIGTINGNYVCLEINCNSLHPNYVRFRWSRGEILWRKFLFFCRKIVLNTHHSSKLWETWHFTCRYYYLLLMH